MPPSDIKKERPDLYSPSTKALALVETPPIQYLMIDGAGDPNDNPEYEASLGALYSVAYGCKFAAKALGADFVVGPLEGLWWADPPESFSLDHKELWLWTMLLWMPEAVTPRLVAEAIAKASKKKAPPEQLAKVAQVRLERYHEGLAAQVLHIGPYAEEGDTIARMHAWIASQGCFLAGKHHEIYLGDPRRTAPEKLKTIIRQPMQRR